MGKCPRACAQEVAVFGVDISCNRTTSQYVQRSASLQMSSKLRSDVRRQFHVHILNLVVDHRVDIDRSCAYL